jgi:Helix-turn-helix domain
MTQCERILKHLESGQPLSPLEALRRYGCLRLAARISDLRSRGHEIETQFVRHGSRCYAKYLLWYPLRKVHRETLDAARVNAG